MKAIIRNRRYDTNTATKLGEWENMAAIRDFAYVCETLYVKRNGEYFLHGEGGANTQYGRALGDNMWAGGERIEPLSYEAARQWAEEHLDADDYERAFAVIEDDSDVVLSVRVPASAKAKLDQIARRTGRSKGEILAELIDSCEL